jgi:CelD/BcsL family acetyltransferase involved in cellulose biosynthesis
VSKWLSFAELDARSADFDAHIARTPEIDRYCSSSHWILPAQAAFAPEARPLVLEVEGAGYAALMSVPLLGGDRVAVPLEASWGLASPFAGEDPAAIIAELFAAIDERTTADDDVPPVLAISGIAVRGRAMTAVVRNARTRGVLRAGPPALRIVADLRGGFDAFLGRRSAKFRASVRRARRAAAANGVSYTRLRDLSPAALAAAWERVLTVERRCWKAHAESGIDAGPMHVFYREMLPRIAAGGQLRLVFVSRGTTDLAYCFGAVFGDTYRGLQVSFDDEYRAESPGVLAHLEMIDWLCEENVAAYDLGSDMDYKRRWGEAGLETGIIVLVRGPTARGQGA